MMVKNRYRFLEVLTSFLLVGAVVLTIAVVMQVSEKGYVTLFGHSMFKVATGSMEPTIETGALIVCENSLIQEISVSDIVCFESTNPMMKGQVITHRVVAIDEVNGMLRLTTQGDANVVSDPLYVTSRNLVGKVIWFSQKGDVMANMVSFMNGKIGFLSCIVLPVLLVCALVMKESMRTIQTEINELRHLEKIGFIETEEEMIERIKREIREELGLSNVKTETEEEMILRLKREIREELGLCNDEKEENHEQ